MKISSGTFVKSTYTKTKTKHNKAWILFTSVSVVQWKITLPNSNGDYVRQPRIDEKMHGISTSIWYFKKERPLLWLCYWSLCQPVVTARNTCKCYAAKLEIFTSNTQKGLGREDYAAKYRRGGFGFALLWITPEYVDNRCPEHASWLWPNLHWNIVIPIIKYIIALCVATSLVKCVIWYFPEYTLHPTEKHIRFVISCVCYPGMDK